MKIAEKEDPKMPVPTPRNHISIENVEQNSLEQEDSIPEDWKDNGEIIIKRKEIVTNLEESVKPWTQTIIEEPEKEAIESDNIEVNVKDIKKFWEVATSPISSPNRSPPPTVNIF